MVSLCTPAAGELLAAAAASRRSLFCAVRAWWCSTTSPPAVSAAGAAATTSGEWCVCCNLCWYPAAAAAAAAAASNPVKPAAGTAAYAAAAAGLAAWAAAGTTCYNNIHIHTIRVHRLTAILIAAALQFTGQWTVQQPAKDGDVSTQLCVSAAVIAFGYETALNTNTVTELNWSDLNVIKYKLSLSLS